MSNSNKPTTAHFDAEARTWADKPRRVLLGRTLAEAIAEDLPLNTGMGALDFGCGVGLVSLPLAPELGHITAADTSPGMLAVLEERLREAGIRNIEPRALSDDADDFGEAAFDLIFTCMVLHHVVDVDAQLKQFARWCAPGGWLVIADLELEDGTFHEGDQGPVHPGFDPQDLGKGLTGLGFTVCRTRTVHTLKRDRAGIKDKEYPLFLLTARRNDAR